jgi:hypothetical protein
LDLKSIVNTVPHDVQACICNQVKVGIDFEGTVSGKVIHRIAGLLNNEKSVTVDGNIVTCHSFSERTLRKVSGYACKTHAHPDLGGICASRESHSGRGAVPKGIGKKVGKIRSLGFMSDGIGIGKVIASNVDCFFRCFHPAAGGVDGGFET